MSPLTERPCRRSGEGKGRFGGLPLPPGLASKTVETAMGQGAQGQSFPARRPWGGGAGKVRGTRCQAHVSELASVFGVRWAQLL